MALSQPIVCPVLIGRAEALASLDRLAARARTGAGQTVLVSGEAGIGKTRLTGELAFHCVRDGWQVLRGSCFEPDRTLPYSAWLDLVRRRLASCSEAEREQLLSAAGPALLRLLPELAPRASAADAAPADAQQEKHEYFRALFAAVTAAGASAPLAVIIEDVHWSDEASLELITYVARRIADRPVLLVVTYRDDEVGEQLAALLAELDRERIATELSLDLLTSPEVEEMLRAIASGGDRALHAGIGADVFSLTEGNPFFIEEVFRSLLDDAGDSGGLKIPRTVREAVRRRSAAVSPEARRLIQLAAVAGRHFDFALLHALSALDEATLIELIRELINAQLIAEESGDRFAFRHALTREAIHSELLARERQTLHETVAATFEELYADTLAAHAGDVGYHYYEARRWSKALEYCRLAGESAERMWAPRAAVEHYGRALDAVRELGQPAPSALLHARGRAYEAIGDFERALADQQLGLATARLNGESEAEWQALLDLGMLWASRNYDRTGEYYQQAIALARQRDDPAMLAHSLNRVGNWYVNVERPQEALEYHEQALSLFEQLDDRPGIAATADLMGIASFMACNFNQGIEYYERAAGLMRELDDRAGLASALSILALHAEPSYHTEMQVPCRLTSEEGLKYGDEAYRLAVDMGRRPAESFPLWSRGNQLGALGRYADALETAGRGLRIAEEIDHDQWIAGACSVFALLYTDIFALDKAVAYGERMLSLARAMGSQYWMSHGCATLADALTAGGDHAAASATLEEVLKADTPAIATGQRLAWCAAAELALAKQDYTAALNAIERLEADTANRGTGREPVRLSLLKGRALAGLGRADEAEASLLEGRENAEISKNLSKLWRLEAALGRLYANTGRKADADTAFERARAVIEALLDNVPEDLRAGFLKGASALVPNLRPATRSSARAGDSGLLTNREREIAALIATGMSNRAIADDLVISERTVETHVSSILSKLGFTSRSQVAVWAAEHASSATTTTT